MWRWSIMRVILRGRRSTWWRWWMTPVAPLIVHDVSCVTRIYDAFDFSWQAHYLETLVDGTCCSAHCKWRFISERLQSWESFLVAGTIFGEDGGSHLLLRLLYWTFHVRQGSTIRTIFRGRCNIWRSPRVTPVASRTVLGVSCVGLSNGVVLE